MWLIAVAVVAAALAVSAWLFPAFFRRPPWPVRPMSPHPHEREELQGRTFRRWLNIHLEEAAHSPINDLFKDLRDGVKLLLVLESLTGTALPREKGRMRVHALNNLNRALHFLQDHHVRLVNVNANDLADGNPKITLGLLWSIIQHSWKIFATDQSLDFKELALHDVLIRWCIYSVQEFEDIDIRNFTSSWEDGRAFNALLHRYKPELFAMDDVAKLSPPERLLHAFSAAEQHLSVKRLLDPEAERVDKKSVMTYLLLLFQALPHDTLAADSPVGGEASSSSTLEAPVSPSGPVMSLAEYEKCLEEVVGWMLEAEDRISSAPVLDSDDVEAVKTQFKDHEDFMLRLTQSQGAVGDALHSGQSLVSSGSLSIAENESVRRQMSLVNEKWERLRQEAMDRQTTLQDRLMGLQTAQLTFMSEWLSARESEIDAAAPLGTAAEEVAVASEAHKAFQASVEEAQAVVNSLSSFVAVVDESSNAEQNYQDLEAQLQSIGKRWMSVCQWAEKRATRLEGLVEAARALGTEQSHFGAWLEAREAALGELKSPQHLTSPKDVLGQVEKLQQMEQDLEAEHPRFVKLSQLSSQVAAAVELENPVKAEKVRKQLEVVTQRWENLVARMEEHSQMLVRSGKISQSQQRRLPKATRVETTTERRSGGGDGSPRVVRRTRTTITTTRTAKAYNPAPSSSDEAQAKKLKMEGASDEGYAGLRSRLCTWLEKAKAHLSLVGPLPPLQAHAALREMESEMVMRGADVEKLQTLGHALAQAESADLDSEEEGEVEGQLREVNEKWRAVQIAVGDHRRSAEFETEAHRFEESLLKVDKVVNRLGDWAKNLDPDALTEVSSIRLALRQCAEKLEEVKKQEPEVSRLQARLESLSAEATPTAALGDLQTHFDHFTQRWEAVVTCISSALSTLTTNLEEAPEPTLTEVVEGMAEFLEGAEEVLATESLTLIDAAPVTAAKLARLGALEDQRAVHADSLRFLGAAVTEPLNRSGLSLADIDDLSARWDAVSDKAESSLSLLRTGEGLLRSWETRAAELEAWMGESRGFLEAEAPAHGDVAGLKEQMGQCTGLVKDMDVLGPKLAQMERDLTEKIAPRATADLKASLGRTLEDMKERWTQLQRLTRAKHKSLSEAQQRTSTVYDEMAGLGKFLAEVDDELSNAALPGTGKELQDAIKRHRHLRDSLAEKSEAVEAAVGLAEELAASLEASPAATEQVSAQLSECESAQVAEIQFLLGSTRAQWSGICGHVEERLASLSAAFETWRELSEAVAGDKVCLEELEKKLAEPLAGAADAEELSEQLDLVERLMGRDEGRLSGLAEALTSQGLLLQPVAAELGKLEAKRAALIGPAQERKAALEASVAEWEGLEAELSSCSSWAAHVSTILAARLHSDILASDVPEEFKRSLAAGSLIPQLQSEMEEHESCLRRLEGSVGKLEAEGRAESAERLGHQLAHLEGVMSRLRKDFGEFKRPRDFETRVERAGRILGDVESGLGLLKPSATSLPELATQTGRANEVTAALAELSTELDYISSTGEKLLEDGMLDKDSPIVAKLHALKPRRLSLTEKVEEAKSGLVAASELLGKLNGKQAAVLGFMTELELSLGRWESEEPEKSIQSDTDFVEGLVNELPRQECELVEVERLAGAWGGTLHSAEVLSARAKSLRNRWDGLRRRLNKWHECLKNMAKDNEGLLLEYEGVGSEVLSWVSTAKARLSQLKASELDAGSPEFVAVHTEANEIRAKVESLRDKAMELTGRGEEWESKVQPSLSSLNTAWDSVLSDLRELQRASHHAPPASPTAPTSPHPHGIPPIIVTAPTPTTSITLGSQGRLERADATEGADGEAKYGRELSEFELRLASLSSEMSELERAASTRLRPPDSVPQWEEQAAAVRADLERLRPSVESILSEGRALADSGPMELHTQNVLEQIDVLHTALSNVEWELDEEAETLETVRENYASFTTRVERLTSWLREAAARDLSRPALCQSTSREMGERRAESEELGREATRLQNSLPSPEEIVDAQSSETTVVLRPRRTIPEDPKAAELRGQWTQLEDMLQKAQQELPAEEAQSRLGLEETPEDSRSISSQSESVVTVRAADSASNTVSDMSDTETPPAEASSSDVATSLALQRSPAVASTQARIPEAREETLSHSAKASQQSTFNAEPAAPVSVSARAASRDAATPDILREPVPSDAPPLPSQTAGIATGLITEGANQLAETLSLIEQRLLVTDAAVPSASPVAGKYGNFSEQEDTLQAVGNNLNEVEEVIEGLRAQHSRLVAAASPGDPQLALSLAALHTRVKANKETHADKERALAGRLSLWQAYHRNMSGLVEFLGKEEAALAALSDGDSTTALEELNRTQTEMEVRVTEKAGTIESVGREASEILPNMEGPEALVLREKLDALSRRWKSLTGSVAARRQLLEERQASDSQLVEEAEELEFWLDETSALLHSPLDPSARQKVAHTLAKLRERRHEMPDKLSRLAALEKAKDAYLEMRLAPTDAKQRLRQIVAQLQSRTHKVKTELEKRDRELGKRLDTSERFWGRLESLESFLASTRGLLEDYAKAIIYTPTSLDPHVGRLVAKVLDTQLRDKEEDLKELHNDYQRLCDLAKAGEESSEVSPETRVRYESVKAEWAAVVEMAAQVRATSSQQSSTISQEQSKPQETESVASSESASVEENCEVEALKMKGKGQEERRLDASTSKASAEDSTRQWREESSGGASGGGGGKSSLAINELRHLRHWLVDTEREAGGPVELSNVGGIKEAGKTAAAFLDALHTKRLGLIRILEDSRDSEVQHKAELLSRDWERAVAAAQKRKKTLAAMTTEARQFDGLRSRLQLWLQDGNSRTVDGPKVGECSEEELSVQLAAVGLLLEQVEEQKTAMSQMNGLGNAMVERYPGDDHTALAQTLSDLNTHWAKFNDNIRIRRAVLEAALRSRQDLTTALGELEEWIRRMEIGLNRLDLDSENPAHLKDPEKRTPWLTREKELRVEMEAHSSVVASLGTMGGAVAESLEDSSEAAALRRRLGELASRWEELGSVGRRVRTRLESAQEAWERLTGTLKELIYWAERQAKELRDQAPVGGDLARVKAQALFVKAALKDVDARKLEVQDAVTTANSFLLQQDLRPVPKALSQTPPEEETTEGRENRRIAQQIRVEADTLERRWAELGTASKRWDAVVDEALGKMYDFDSASRSCEAAVADAETERRDWRPVKELQLDQLPQQLAALKGFRTHLLGLVRTRVDEVNDKSSRLLADNIQLSPESAKILDALNTRYKQVETALAARLNGLQNAMKDFGPSSQHFLVHSVAAPWERSVSANRVPYFLNHTTEKTQWDHPKMVELVGRLCDFNEVKFSAYRTGIKLRALQKRLCLDLVALSDLDAAWSRGGLGASASPDRLIDVSEMVMVLLGVYEPTQAAFPDLVRSLPLAIDLCLNFLLNVYDSARSGAMRLLSFKLALVLLSKAHLDEKYRYLFALLTGGPDHGIDQKKLALLLYDAVQIPKFLGEVAAFGGSNVEPSVRSCFKRNKFPAMISEAAYLDWLLMEPQSLVWMPVLHRIAAAEISKHQAKCNVCKMFPIVGLRYRCLKCFNFDVCQNCFFSQRTAKGHRITHPMQEYCIASTSGEDVRDFSKVVRNKFRSKRSLSRSNRLGYLPVQSVEEGAPLEARNLTPSNAETQHIHGRLELFATRLAVMDKSLSDKTDDDAPTPDLADSALPKSPAQILQQIDHAQKEELDQIMRQLEDENRRLQAEYSGLKASRAGSASVGNGHHSLPRATRHSTLPNRVEAPGHQSMTSLGDGPNSWMTRSGVGLGDAASEASGVDLLAEARALRLHKQRLEERSRVLEEHNGQLEVQLLRLKTLIQQHQLGGSESASIDLTSLSPPAAALGTPTPPVSATPVSTTASAFHLKGIGGTSDETDTSGPDQTGKRIGALMSTAADLGRAMESLVTAVTSDEELSEPDS